MAGDKTIWSVGGGMGGAGKSTATVNIGSALARRGKKVVLVDADPRGGLQDYFGMKGAARGLDDFLNGRLPGLNSATAETGIKNLRLLSGAGEALGGADTAHYRKISAHFNGLDAEYIIVDLGGGSSGGVLDFFSLSTAGIVVLAPEPSAMQNAYIFLKGFVYRRLKRLFSGNPSITRMITEATDARSPGAVKSFSELCERLSAADPDSAHRASAEIGSYTPKLFLNMATRPEDEMSVEAFGAACLAFLGLSTEYIGALYSRPAIAEAARMGRPFMLDENAVDARKELEFVVARLLGEKVEPPPKQQEAPSARGLETEACGFNDNVSHAGAVFHVQTEARGGREPMIETVVYSGGRIFFSKKTPWKAADGGADIRESAARQHGAAIAAIKMNRITFQG